MPHDPVSPASKPNSRHAATQPSKAAAASPPASKARTKPASNPASNPPSPKPSAGPSSGASPFPARVSRLAAIAAEKGLSHLVVTNPMDVGYLTGFLGGDSVLIVSADRPVIVSDFRYQEELHELSGWCGVVIRKAAMSEALAGVLSGAERIGIQAEHMTVAERDALAKRVAPKKVASTSGLVAAMRRVKDEHEIALIRKAARIAEDALKALLPTIKPGQTERAIAARLESEMKLRGASKPGFDTIVAARANGSMPHYRPAAAKTSAGQPLLIDWGAVYQGYHSDHTRTFALGKWPKKLADIYAIVLDAHEAAAAALAAGKRSADIDKIARDLITKAGYGEHFGHGLGHGIGLNGHEDPRLHHMLTGSTLQPGNVVTIEPGIYIPGLGGVRIEDDYLVTDTGSVNLGSLPRTLEWSTLA